MARPVDRAQLVVSERFVGFHHTFRLCNAEVRAVLLNQFRAKFDPALYTGDRLEQGKTTFCLNVDQFRQLQAVEARAVYDKRNPA